MKIETIHHATRNIPEVTSYIDGVHFVASEIGRQEVTIAGAIEASASINVYAYFPEAAEDGLVPWRMVDGIDPYVGGEVADVCFASGACKNINLDDTDIRFFVSAKDIDKQAAA